MMMMMIDDDDDDDDDDYYYYYINYFINRAFVHRFSISSCRFNGAGDV